jgi:3-methyladenine DNA glycosylase AlkD
MDRLAAAGTEHRRRIYARRGAGENQFGASFGDLRGLSKEIGPDQALALDLWATGNTDARLLACMIVEPSLMTDADLDPWLSDIDYYVLADEFSKVAARVPGVRDRMERWTASERDWTGQAGFDLLAQLAMDDPSLDDAFFLGWLGRIEREIHARPNRTRHAMNGAVLAIGLRDDPLRVAATEVARRMGPVIVDHGETGCVTPDAVQYIERAYARGAPRRARLARDRAKLGGKPAG